MKNLNDLFNSYPRVYEALQALIMRKVPYDIATDIFHDYIVYIDSKIDWTLEDNKILSFLYKGLNLYLKNRTAILSNYTHVHNEQFIAVDSLSALSNPNFTDNDESIELEIEDKKATHSTLQYDLKQLADKAITGSKMKDLLNYYIQALEQNATDIDFRQNVAAQYIGVTNEWVRRMTNKIAEYLGESYYQKQSAK